MLGIGSRSAVWPIALTLVALTACSDEPTVPAPFSTPKPHAVLNDIITVTNTSGGTELGSLRWAANQVDMYSDVIRIDPTLGGDTITLDYVLDVDKPLTIEGPADGGITIRGTGGDRVLRPRGGLTLRNVTVSNGSGPFGSGIYTDGSVLLENSTVRDNLGSGAAVYGYDVVLINSTVSGNQGLNLYNTAGILYVAGLTMSNSTVANNGPGAGVGQTGTSPVPAIVTLRNSIIAYNGVFPYRNCRGSVANYVGRNISNDNSCGDSSSTMLVADPLLGPLAHNGGPTPTHSLAFNSPAVNAGVNCNVTVDQRYVSRDSTCDVGAFEFTDYTTVTITIDANATVDAPTGTATVTGTVRCSRTGDQFGLVVPLRQQKGGKNPTVVQGAGSATITSCGTAAQPWSALVTPTTGTFDTGSATTSATTSGAPTWVKPATTSRTVKLVRVRR